MKSTIKILLCLLLVVFVFGQGNFSLAANQAELQEAIKKKNEELQQVNTQIQETQKQLGAAQGEAKTLKKEIAQTNKQISQFNLNIRSSELIIEKLNLEINSLQYDISDTENKVELKKEAIAEILRQLQRVSEETPLTIFLKSSRLTDGVFEIQGLKDFNNNLAIEVSELQTFEIQLNNALGATIDKQQQVKNENQTLKHKKIISDNLKKSKQVILTQTKNQEKIYQQQLNNLEKQQIAIFDEINKVEEELRRKFDPSLLPAKRQGVFIWPIKLVRDGGIGKISQIYGETAYSHLFYKGKPHNGIDIEVPIGTPVYAMADGVVTAVDNNDMSSFLKYQYGKYVLIKHDNNLSTLYAHLSMPLVSKGSSAKRGDLIGYSGNTGFSTGPHLHFGVYWAPSITMASKPPANGLVPIGITVNPEDYL